MTPVLLAVSPTTAILLSFLVLAIILVARGIKIVRQAEVMLVERLGKFHRMLTPGIKVLWPIIDKPRQVAWMSSLWPAMPPTQKIGIASILVHH